MALSDEIRRRLQAQPEGGGDHEPVRLPAQRFVDRAFHEAERARIFSKAWLVAGRLDEVSRPGLYLTWEKTRVPLLIVHAVDGVVRCFYNSCRHRGAPVVRVARGRNRALRCQYHSWTYDTSGKLVSVPDERDFVDLQREERGLVPAACALGGGAIFVNEDAGAPDLGAWFGAAGEELRAVGGEGLRTLDQRSATVPANWKRVLGRLLAAPPVPPRPALAAPAADARGADVEALGGGHLRIVAPFEAASAEALGLTGPLDWGELRDEGLATIGGLDPMLRSTATTYVLFPNLLLTFTPSGILSFAAWPQDEKKTLLDATWYAPDWGEDGTPAEDPAWRTRREWAQGQLDATVAALAGDQDTLRESARRGISLEDGSTAVRLWNEALDARLGGAALAGALSGRETG